MMRIIAHIDMDAFFAAVEEREHPRLKGKPIVVGSDPEEGKGRGVVATANYAARKYGIHSAMPITKAWQLAEAGRQAGGQPVVFMEGRHANYAKVSEHIMEILSRYAPEKEQASIDEAYIDLSGLRSFEAARETARAIKVEILRKEALTASIGIGPNKMLAKIASDLEKPDGLTVITPEDVEDILGSLPVRKIPGLGPKSAIELAKLKIVTIGQLRRLGRDELKEIFGAWGDDVYDRARGKDDAPLREAWTAKSVGEQETFRYDTLEPSFLAACIGRLAEDVFRRFENDGFNDFRTVVLTVRFADFTTRNRSHTFPEPVRSEKELAFQGLRLLIPFLDARENPGREPIRLLGLRVEKLS